MPSDAFQVRALARLLTHFGWSWLGVIGVETDYARFAIQHFLQESAKVGVCTAYAHLYPVNPSAQDLDKLLNVIQVINDILFNFKKICPKQLEFPSVFLGLDCKGYHHFLQ